MRFYYTNLCRDVTSHSTVQYDSILAALTHTDRLTRRRHAHREGR